MASEEQYLDELLKSMMNTDSRTMEETMRELNMGAEPEEPVKPEEPEMAEPEEPVMPEEPEMAEQEEPVMSEKPEMAEQAEPVISEETENAVPTEERMDVEGQLDSEWQADLDELLQSMVGTESTENGVETDGSIASEDAEIASDLADIHAMLKMAEQNNLDDNSAEEMRALLQGIEETDASEPQKEVSGERKKSKRKKFWKRKKNDDVKEPSESGEDNETDALGGLDSETDAPQGEKLQMPEELVHGWESEVPDGFVDPEGVEIPEKELQVKEKKPGLFARIMNFLLQEEPEEALEASVEEQTQENEIQENATGENAQILEELDSEKKKKKEKKGKKGKKGKLSSGEEPEGEEAEGGKKGKKEKKQKEKKPKKEKGTFKKEPALLSTRVRLGLIAFGATFVAAILLLSVFLPEHADRIAAREAYYQGDYETAFQNLNDQHLGASDALIYHRSKTILSLQRKLDSYENRMKLGQQTEALDALFCGVELYDQLVSKDTYGVAEELTGIYQSMCEILETDYGVSAEEAVEINTYDAETYTRKLASLVYDTAFDPSGEEAEPSEEPSEEPVMEPMQDVLEEEEMFLAE